EKASMDVPAPAAGEIVELRVKVGDRVSTGDALLVLKRDEAAVEPAAPAPAQRPSAGAAAAPASARPAAAPIPSPAPTTPTPTPTPAPRASDFTPAPSFVDAHASPSVRKLARELGV